VVKELKELKNTNTNLQTEFDIKTEELKKMSIFKKNYEELNQK